MDEPARRLRAPIDRLPTRRAHACVAFRKPSEDARTVDGEYEPISVVGSTVYRLASNGDAPQIPREVAQTDRPKARGSTTPRASNNYSRAGPGFRKDAAIKVTWRCHRGIDPLIPLRACT